MDYGRSFKYVFDDQDWLKKIAIGGVLNIIPIANFIPIGYSLRALRSTAEGHDLPLPEWDDWGGDFVRGLLVLVAVLIYALPIFILQGLAMIIGAVAGSASSDAAAVAGLCITAVSCLAGIWGLLMGIFIPAAYTRYTMDGGFGAFFRFGEIWSFIRGNLGSYIIAILLILVVQLVAAIVGSIACGIGVAFTSFWGMLVSANLLGQVYAESQGGGESASFGYEAPADTV